MINLPQDPQQTLLSHISNISSLTALRINNCFVTSCSTFNLKNLTDLDLSNNIPDRNLLSQIGTLPLQRLILSNCSLTNDSLNSISTLTMLKILDIQINDLNDILSITNLTSLTELTIGSPFINIAESAFGKVTLSQQTAEQLSNMPALTKIFLKSQQIIPTTRKVRPTNRQFIQQLRH